MHGFAVHPPRSTTVVAILATIVLTASLAQAKISTISTTVPSNGDVNPYGVAIVPNTQGNLVKGNILVSNFNNSQNLQGTGTTIVQISPSGSLSLFAQIDAKHLPGACPGGVGLTTALVSLRSGFVIVGSLPTTDGMSDTAKAGCLLVLNNTGKVVETFYGSLINGPWDMTAFDDDRSPSLFVTNVLNGTVAGGGKVVKRGTVVRIDLTLSKNGPPAIQQMTVIGSGFSEKTDPAALVIGPTGVALSRDRDDDGHGHNQTLYVADTVNNRIVAIPDALNRNTSAGTGSVVTKGGALNGPLGLTLAPNGDLLSVNGGDGNMVVTRVEDHRGKQIRKVTLDNMNGGGGALFGLAAVAGQGVYFVDDNQNNLNLFH
jgi:hypothetical protein